MNQNTLDEHPKKITVNLGMLAAASLFSFCVVAFRIVYAGRSGYIFLVWNLLLAWIPFLCALFAEHFLLNGHKVRKNVWIGLFGFLWLIFFPNAPYIVTDFTHLQLYQRGLFWFDFVMIASFAATGILLGLCSLQIMQRITLKLIGRFWSWLFMVTVSLLSGFGIYLGRYLRWNSWDIITNPNELMQDIFTRLNQPLSYPQTWFISILFAALVISSFLVFNHFCHYRSIEVAKRKTN